MAQNGKNPPSKMPLVAPVAPAPRHIALPEKKPAVTAKTVVKASAKPAKTAPTKATKPAARPAPKPVATAKPALPKPVPAVMATITPTPVPASALPETIFSVRISPMTKMMPDFKMPTLDFTAVLASQRKNFEALTAANQLALEGMQAVFRRQSELVRESLEESSKLVSEFLAVGTPEEKVMKNVDLMKGAFEKTLGNVKEVTTLISKSQTEASDVITGRVKEGIDEVKSAIAQVALKRA
jgi:phasin family protein